MRLWPIFAAAIVAGGPANADLTATYVNDNGLRGFEMTVEVAANGDLRADMEIPGLYMIRRDGRFYFVVQYPEGPVVQDLVDVGVVTQEEMSKLFPDLCDELGRAGPSFRLVSRGAVTIAGRRGEAYASEGRDDSRHDVVISRDSALAPLGAAIGAQFRMSTTLMGGCASNVPKFAQMQALLESGAPLQTGPVRLDKVKSGPIDPERFDLPATPETREQVRARMIRKDGPTATVQPRLGN